jgi:hypothetical protein
MKKMVLAMTAALVMSMGAVAQDEQKAERRERGQFDQTEMIQRRTDATVKKYGLNDEQAKKLLEQNTKFAGKMGPRRGRPHAMSRQPDRRPGDSVSARRGRNPQRMERRDSAGGPRPEMRPMTDEMRKNMEAYEAGIKEILTEEQYKAYQEDMKNRRMPGGDRGPRRR